VTEPVFPFWLLRGLGDEVLKVQPFDAPRPPHYQILPAMFPIGYLRQWLHDPDARRVLLEIYATLFGAQRLTAWSHDEVAQAVGPALAVAFERGDLLVLTPWRRNGVPPGKQQSEPPPPPPAQQKTWIEVVLLDGDDQPVKNAAYRLTLPGGEKRTGWLDEKGFVRVDGIDAGTCDVEFPEIDGREWGKTKLPKA
jgi:hypothetical protein